MQAGLKVIARLCVEVPTGRTCDGVGQVSAKVLAAGARLTSPLLRPDGGNIKILPKSHEALGRAPVYAGLATWRPRPKCCGPIVGRWGATLLAG